MNLDMVILDNSWYYYLKNLIINFEINIKEFEVKWES